MDTSYDYMHELEAHDLIALEVVANAEAAIVADDNEIDLEDNSNRFDSVNHPKWIKQKKGFWYSV